MKHAVFFDIDGTLWDEHMRVPESTVSAIRKLRENGDYAFICSGRSRAAIRAKELLEDIGFDGIIGGCGTYIEYRGKVIYESLLSQEEIVMLVETLRKNGMPAILEGSEYLYADMEAFGDDPYVSYLKGMLGDGFRPMQGCEGEYKANKLSADYTNGDVEGVKRDLSLEYDLIFHAEKAVEILPKGFSKATGIKKICEYLNISHENTYAFGDSANDIEMLQYVSHGIAMGNATDDAKQAADYITSSLWQDGILAGLEHFSLI